LKVLISGTNSGLGNWLSKQFPECDKYTRDTKWSDLKDEYDLIIHCAAAITHNGWDNVSIDLFEDNVFLTRDLANIPHTKFIYISSIDEAKDSPYGVTKRISEIIVKDLCKNYLILRPSSLIGEGMKKNTFQKIVHGDDIALTPDTIMNFILYEDVLDAIKFDMDTLKSDMEGLKLAVQATTYIAPLIPVPGPPVPVIFVPPTPTYTGQPTLDQKDSAMDPIKSKIIFGE